MSELQDQVDTAIKAHEAGDAQAAQQLTAAKQALVDAKAADAIEDAAYEAKIKDLQTRLDKLEAPVVAPLLLGANVGPLPDKSQYPDQMDVTRIYFASGDSNYQSSNGGVKGQALKYNPKFVMSSHAGSNAEYDALCKSRTAVTGVEDIMIRRHEPESKVAKGQYTIAQWQTEQRRASAIARNENFDFGMILMSWTILRPTAGRTFEAYMDALDPDLYDLPGVDWYPDNTPNDKIADSIAKIQDKFTKWAGDKPWVLGEVGVNGKANSAKAVDQIGQMFAALKDTNCAQVCFFSVGEDAMTAPVAKAFFG